MFADIAAERLYMGLFEYTGWWRCGGIYMWCTTWFVYDRGSDSLMSGQIEASVFSLLSLASFSYCIQYTVEPL